MKRKRFDRRNWQRVVGGGDQTTLALPGGLIVDYRAARGHHARWKCRSRAAPCGFWIPATAGCRMFRQPGPPRPDRAA